MVDPSATPGEISRWQSCNDSRVASVRLKHTEEEKEGKVRVVDAGMNQEKLGFLNPVEEVEEEEKIR